MVKISTSFQKCLIFLLQVYTYLVSPVLGQACRFSPSCSKYAQFVIREYGCYVGICMTIKRLLRCNPWYQGSLDDPVQKFLKPPKQ